MGTIPKAQSVPPKTAKALIPAAVPAPDQPGKTIAWEGSRERYNDWVVGIGALAIGGLAALILYRIKGASGHPITSGGRSAIAATGVAGAVFSATALKLFQEGKHSVAQLPSPDTVPSLPSPTAGMVATSTIRPETNVVRWTGSKQVWVKDRDSQGRPNGGHYEMRNYAGVMATGKQLGKLDGYATSKAAIDDAGGRGTTVVMKDAGKWFIHETDSVYHDLDTLSFQNSNVAALIGHGEYVLVPSSDRYGYDNERTLSTNTPTKHFDGERVGDFVQPGIVDPALTGEVLASTHQGYPTLEDALGDAKARAGDQGVVKKDDRFYTYNIISEQPDPNHELVGLAATQRGSESTALEFDNNFYVPAANYWVAPNH